MRYEVDRRRSEVERYGAGEVVSVPTERIDERIGSLQRVPAIP